MIRFPDGRRHVARRAGGPARARHARPSDRRRPRGPAAGAQPGRDHRRRRPAHASLGLAHTASSVYVASLAARVRSTVCPRATATSTDETPTATAPGGGSGRTSEPASPARTPCSPTQRTSARRRRSPPSRAASRAVCSTWRRPRRCATGSRHHDPHLDVAAVARLWEAYVPLADDELSAPAATEAVDALSALLPEETPGCPTTEARRSFGPSRPRRPAAVGALRRVIIHGVSERVVRVEKFPLGSRASRRLVCAMSDGTEQTALEFVADEILVSRGRRRDRKRRQPAGQCDRRRSDRADDVRVAGRRPRAIKQRRRLLRPVAKHRRSLVD